jgi:glycosyltransferase involved in cell wall biosynthesis
LRTGGAEINIVRLSQALAARGDAQRVVSLTPEVESDLSGRLNVPFEAVPCARRLPAAASWLVNQIDRYQVTVLHGTNLATWADCVAARLVRPRVRLVQCFQGPGSFERGGWRHHMAGMLRRFTDGFVAVSPDIRDRLQSCWGVPADRIRVIPNLVDTQHFAPSGDRQAIRAEHDVADRFVIGTVGSLYEVKNHRLLLEAFATLHSRFPESVLWIVGDGPLRARLAQLVERLGIGDAVRFCGRHSDVRPLLVAMDAYVQASTMEGSPLAVMEALATQVAVVAAPSPGCVNMEEETGVPWIVRPPEPATLAEVLRRLIVDPSWRRGLAQRGRDIITQHYAMETAVDAYRKVLCPATSAARPVLQQIEVGSTRS